MDIKKTILKTFNTPETHPTAEELYQRVKADHEVSADEFLRVLDELKKEKQIYTVASSDNKDHFGKEKGPHYHFICQSCGKVYDFQIDEGTHDMVEAYINSKVHSFGRVDKINMSVQGICNHCKKGE
jgi:Fur family transcriptional regulator, peroxide stress response regulator